MKSLFRVCGKRGRYWAVRIAGMRLRHVLRRKASFLNFQLQLPGFSSLEAVSRLLLGQEKQAFIDLEVGQAKAC